MKKIIASLLVAVFAVAGLSACQGGNAAAEKAKQEMDQKGGPN
jgi:hypothetical protein